MREIHSITEERNQKHIAKWPKVSIIVSSVLMWLNLIDNQK